jgi:hypothetical protein
MILRGGAKLSRPERLAIDFGLLVLLLFFSATPLAADEQVQTVAAPVFSETDPFFNAQMWVSITCSTEGAQIRYTTDDTTVPSSTVGTIFKEPIYLPKFNWTIRAIAYKPGWNDSPVVFVTFFGAF